MDGSGYEGDVRSLLDAMERACARAQAMGDIRLAGAVRHAIHQIARHGDSRPADVLRGLKRFPVTIVEFVESPDFLGGRIDVWPALMEDLRHLNPDVLLGAAPVHEAYLGGATGIGKSTLARVTILYQSYFLSCFCSPQALFGLETQTPLVFALQSVTPDVTRRVLYEPLRAMFETMPFAQKHLDWDRRRTAALELAGGIHIVPVLAAVEPLLGQAIPGAILDEVNFMRVVENSVRVPGPRGLGGRFDQAEELASELIQRRKSRFQGAPISIGTLIFCSSARYIGDFLDRRITELEEGLHPNAFWSRHKRYDVVPSDRYSGERFGLLLGNERHRTRPLDDDEEVPDDCEIELVPVEHLEEFHRHPETALRSILGRGSDSLNPFIDLREKINDAIVQGTERRLQPWIDKSEILLARDGWPRLIDENMPTDPGQVRFVHTDLSVSRDACGIAVVKLDGFSRIKHNDDLFEVKPRFAVELALAIHPSPEAEILISEVRDFIAQLVTRHGLNIVEVSSDAYRGPDFRQALRSLGIRIGEISVDRDHEPYEHLRICLYEDRLALVESAVLERELSDLERNRETGRIDHPPRGSKDVSDAVAGALFAAVSSAHVRRDTGFFDGQNYRLERPRSNIPRPRGSRRR